ncbi:MAG: hypothetical protein RJB38_988, partial [Pseudomonadota bacterium]
GLEPSPGEDDGYQGEFFIAKILKSSAPWRPPVLETDRLLLRPLELA